MGAKVVNGRKYERVAPDGGWGYMICIGAIINVTTVTGFLATFGMLYKTLFIELDMDSTSVTLLNGVGASCVAVSGIFTAPLLKFLSIRQLGLITAVIFNIGNFLIVFVRSKIVFFILIGILQSYGNSILFNLSCTALNNYFVKKRVLAVSIVNTVVGISALLAPQFIKWSLETYGFRGALLLVSGISLHNIVGTALLQPVEWHMKMVEIPGDKENGSEEKPLTSSEDINIVKTDIDFDKQENVEDQKPNNFIKTIILSICDVSLFKTFVLSNACIGTALMVFVDTIFIVLLPQSLYAMGLNDSDVAWALSMFASGDLVTRFLFIFISSWLCKIGSHETYIIALVLTFISRIGLLWSDNKLIITIFITLMGVSRCAIVTLVQVVVADSVEQNKFSSAMGLLLLIYGFFYVVVGPTVGAIRDLTDSYSTAFYILISCIGIVIISWTIELIYKKNKHKRQPKEFATKV